MPSANKCSHINRFHRERKDLYDHYGTHCRRAAGRWRRPPRKRPQPERDIILVGASKMNDDAACQEAIAAGVDALGENRVQEMTAKLAQNAYDGAPLHFIGHLQRNKVRQVVGKAALIQSIGSEALLREVEKRLPGSSWCRISCWR